MMPSRASLEPHIAMVHEGVRKKCEICNKVNQTKQTSEHVLCHISRSCLI